MIVACWFFNAANADRALAMLFKVLGQSFNKTPVQFVLRAPRAAVLAESVAVFETHLVVLP